MSAAGERESSAGVLPLRLWWKRFRLRRAAHAFARDQNPQPLLMAAQRMLKGLRPGDDPIAHAEVNLLCGIALEKTGDSAAAIPYLEVGLERCRDPHESVARLLRFTLGVAQEKAGCPELGRSNLERALELAKDVKDHSEVTKIQTLLALLARRSDSSAESQDGALFRLREAVEAARLAGDAGNLLRSRELLASALAELPVDLLGRSKLLREALTSLEGELGGAVRRSGHVSIMLASAYRSAAQPSAGAAADENFKRRAIELYFEALGSADALHDAKLRCQANLGLAEIHSDLALHDDGLSTDLAAQYFDRAAAEVQPGDPQYLTAKAGLVAVLEGAPTDQLRHRERALRELQELMDQGLGGTVRAGCHEAMGRLLSCRQRSLGSDVPGTPEELLRAIEHFQEASAALEFADAGAERHALLDACIGDAYFSLRRFPEALDAYRMAGIVPDPGAAPGPKWLKHVYQAAYAAGRVGRLEEAVLTLDRGKTLLVRAGLAHVLPRPAGVPDAVWARHGKERERLLDAERRLTSEESSRPDLVATHAAARKSMEEARARFESSLEAIRIHAPDFAVQPTLAEVQRRLTGPDAVVVFIVVSDQGTMAFVLTESPTTPLNRIDIPTFTSAELFSILAVTDESWSFEGGWMVAYHGGDLDSWKLSLDRALDQLGSAVVGPLIHELPAGVQRVTLVLPQLLNQFPLHAARVSTGRQWLDLQEVNYVVSASIAALGREEVPARATCLCLGVNPTDDKALQHASVEGEMVRSCFADAVTYRGVEVTVDSLREQRGTATHYHLICHGDSGSAAESSPSIELANGDLTLDHLIQADLGLEAAVLVVLSACETGLARLDRSNDSASLAGGFQLAGVPFVVSTLWRVPDLSTAVLMGRFYADLGSSGEPGAALRSAQRWLRDASWREIEALVRARERAHPEPSVELVRLLRLARAAAERAPDERPFTHPFYWAAFQLHVMGHPPGSCHPAPQKRDHP